MERKTIGLTKYTNEELKQMGIPYVEGRNGWVRGDLIHNFIVGETVEVTEFGPVFEWWVEVLEVITTQYKL